MKMGVSSYHVCVCEAVVHASMQTYALAKWKINFFVTTVENDICVLLYYKIIIFILLVNCYTFKEVLFIKVFL